MTITLTRPAPVLAPPVLVLVDDYGEYEACLTALTTLTDPDDRALYLHMASYHAERCAVLTAADLDAHDEWAVTGLLCRAVAATERGYVLPRLAAWMDSPYWDELAAGEYDRAGTLRVLRAAIGHLLPGDAARVLERLAATEVTR